MTRAVLRDLAIVLLLGGAIAVGAQLAHRRASYDAGQRQAATRAVQAIIAGEPVPGAVTAWVSAPTPGTHPRVARRVKWSPDTNTSSRLGGPDASVLDLTFARWADRALAANATQIELLADGAAGAAVPSPRDGTAGAWIAYVAPAATPAWPWIGSLGIALCALGLATGAARLLRGPHASWGRAASLFAGGLLLAATPFLRGQLGAAVAIAAVAALVAIAHARGTTARLAAALRAHRVALAFVAPAALAMLVIVGVPFAVGLGLGFFDHHRGEWSFVGLGNFAEILSGGGHPLSDPLNFYFVLGVTLAWTFVNVALHVTCGVALALALTRPWLRGKAALRMLLILPWAIPNYITALVWKGMFQGEYGAVNQLLDWAGVDGVSWFSSWSTAFAANVATNTWLGFPFMMVVAIGALESIPRDLYEAAAVDGASAWQRFRLITLPHLRVGMAPAIALGSIWTFNMFNVIFLVSAGAPGGSTNILVTDAYRWAFERGERYGMAAAYATIIFALLLAWSLWGAWRRRRAEAA